jgi:CheY-like chemotaxis protein
MSDTKSTGTLRSYSIINKNRTELPSSKIALVGLDDTLAQVVLAMKDAGVNEASVVDEGKIIGTVTEKDAVPLLAQMAVTLEKNHERVTAMLDRTKSIATATTDAAIAAINTAMSSAGESRGEEPLRVVKDTLESLRHNILETLDTSEQPTEIELGVFLTQLAATVQTSARIRGLQISVSPIAETTVKVQARLLGQTLRHILESAIKDLDKGNTITLTASLSHRQGFTGSNSLAGIKATVLRPRSSEQQNTQNKALSQHVIAGMIRDLKDKHPDLKFAVNGDEQTLFDMSLPALRVVGQTKSNFAAAKILIVEDDSDILDMLEEILSEAGFESIRASDGEEALGLFAKHKPRLVLADIRMPKLDGINLSTALKNLAPEIPVILCSGQYPQLMEDKMDNRISCDHVLYKPFAKNDIIESIRLFLDVSGAS